MVKLETNPSTLHVVKMTNNAKSFHCDCLRFKENQMCARAMAHIHMERLVCFLSNWELN